MFASATNNVLVAADDALSRRWMVRCSKWRTTASPKLIPHVMVMSIYCTARVELIDCSIDWLDCLAGLWINWLVGGATYQNVQSWFSPCCTHFMEHGKLTKNISEIQMDVYILRTCGISVLMQTD